MTKKSPNTYRPSGHSLRLGNNQLLCHSLNRGDTRESSDDDSFPSSQDWAKKSLWLVVTINLATNELCWKHWRQFRPQKTLFVPERATTNGERPTLWHSIQLNTAGTHHHPITQGRWGLSGQSCCCRMMELIYKTILALVTCGTSNIITWSSYANMKLWMFKFNLISMPDVRVG